MTQPEFYKSTAWKWFSRVVLLSHCNSDFIVKCATCSSYLIVNEKKCQAGHFRKVHAHKSTAFEFKNVLPQCDQCNRYNGGREYEMSLEIDRVFGKGTAEHMRIKSLMDGKLSKFGMDLIAKEYKAKFDVLIKEKFNGKNPWKK